VESVRERYEGRLSREGPQASVELVEEDYWGIKDTEVDSRHEPCDISIKWNGWQHAQRGAGWN
jgi:hypothetical protein